MSENFVAIGDIHGCYKTVRSLVEQLSDFYDRTFVFLGDYIDRGPSSKETVQFLIDFSRSVRCVFIRGNHEQMLLESQLSGRHFSRWMQNGGRTTLTSYGQTQMNVRFESSHHHFYRNTKLFFNSGDYVFVHGGFDPDKTLAEQIPADESEMPGDVLWEREHIHADTSMWEKTVVFGHSPMQEPFLAPKKIGIDTGCVYKNLPGFGRLTAVLLPEMKFYFQSCLDSPNPY